MTTLSNRYRLVRKLGAQFEQVYVGQDLTNGQQVAIKLEWELEIDKQMHIERPIYEKLIDIKCIPRVHDYAQSGGYSYMVMDLLGASLQDLLDSRPNKRLSLKTVLMLGDQMLRCVEAIHSRGVIHRNIKPSNFVMGVGENAHKVYMIDFGESCLYLDDAQTGEHIKFRRHKQLHEQIGDPNFTSPNSNRRFELSRRDDLFSLGYTLVYLMRGSHPWEFSGLDNWYEYLDVLKKDTIWLCYGLPCQFIWYFNYVKRLKFKDTPDYKYLRGLLSRVIKVHGFVNDYEYDWCIREKEGEE